MTAIHLHPCLCGSHAELKWDSTGYRVECQGCELTTSYCLVHEVVVKIWNEMERPKPHKKRSKFMESAEVMATLPFTLGADEIEEQARQATRLMSQLDNMEEEYKLVKRGWNKKLKDIKLQVRKTCQSFASKIDEREVKAEHCFDIDSGKCWYAYGGMNFLERDITDEERDKLKQGTLFDDGANVPASPPPGNGAAKEMPW